MKIISGAHRLPGHAFCDCGTEFEFSGADGIAGSKGMANKWNKTEI